MDNLKEKGVIAFSWDFFGKLATHGMQFVVSIFLARLLEPSDFGLIAMVMVIFGLATVFTDVGLGAALIQRRRNHEIHYSSVFYFNIFVGILLTLLVYYSAALISEFYNNKELLPIIQIMSVMFILTSFSSLQTTLLAKELNYRLLTKIKIFSALVSGIIGIVMALKGAGVWSLVSQILINMVIYNIIIWSITKWSPSFMFSWKALAKLWGFGFRMFLVGLLDAIYTRMDLLIIGKVFGAATLGYFQRAQSLNFMAIQYSSGSLMTVLFPILSKVKNDLPRFQKIITKLLGIVSFLTFFIFSCLFLVSEELIVILFTDKWLPSVVYFKILAFSGVTYPLNSLLVNILKSRGNSKDFLRMALYKKGIGVLNLIIGFYYGIEGYLYGLILVGIISTGISIHMASRESKMSSLELYKPILQQAVVAAISIIITLLVLDDLLTSDIASLISKIGIFLLSYFLINWWFKTSSFNYFIKELITLRKRI